MTLTTPSKKVASLNVTGTYPFPSEIFSISVACENEVCVFVCEKYIEDPSNTSVSVRAKLGAYKASLSDLDDYEVYVFVLEDDISVIREAFTTLHEWKPDIVGTWCMAFDIDLVLKSIGAKGLDPSKVLCDHEKVVKNSPIVFYPGFPTRTETTLGKSAPRINPIDRRPHFRMPGTFKVLDAMVEYRKRRITDQLLPSYTFDFVYMLECPDGVTPVLPGTEQFSPLNAHKHLINHAPLDLLAIEAIKTIRLLKFEEATKDLSLAHEVLIAE